MHSIFWFRTRQWVLSRVLHLTADGETVTIPSGLHSNGILATMAGCNCLIEMEAAREGNYAGEQAEVLLL